MNEKEKYKKYYSQIKLDDKTAQRIRNDMHSVKRQKNNSFSVHTFNRYASLASCFLVMVFALNSIAGRTYTLPVYHVETTEETAVTTTLETEIVTSDETTEYQYGTGDDDIITTTVLDEDLPSENVTVVPDIEDDVEDIDTDSEDNEVTTETNQDNLQTNTRDETTKKPSVTRPPKNTETAKPTTPTTKPPQTTQTTGAVTTEPHTHTTTINSEPPVITTVEGTSVAPEVTTKVVETTEDQSEVVVTTMVEVVTTIVLETTMEGTEPIPEQTQTYETTTWVYETTSAEQTETLPETAEQYYIQVLVKVDKPSNIDLFKVIDEDTYYIGIGRYSNVNWEIITTDDTKYVVKFVLTLAEPTKLNTSSAVSWIKNNPIKGQISVYYSD